jgi:hypothetical protein
VRCSSLVDWPVYPRSLLARMARFIIADLTDPSSIPKEWLIDRPSARE